MASNIPFQLLLYYGLQGLQSRPIVDRLEFRSLLAIKIATTVAMNEREYADGGGGAGGKQFVSRRRPYSREVITFRKLSEMPEGV